MLMEWVTGRASSGQPSSGHNDDPCEVARHFRRKRRIIRGGKPEGRMLAQRKYVMDRWHEGVVAANDNGAVRFPGMRAPRDAGIVGVAVQLAGSIALSYVAGGVFTITQAELAARAA
jgi:hypothetical protein